MVGRQPRNFVLKEEDFFTQAEKLPNTVSRPYTGARYPVSGPVRCLCFGDEGIFLVKVDTGNSAHSRP